MVKKNEMMFKTDNTFPVSPVNFAIGNFKAII